MYLHGIQFVFRSEEFIFQDAFTMFYCYDGYYNTHSFLTSLANCVITLAESWLELGLV